MGFTLNFANTAYIFSLIFSVILSTFLLFSSRRSTGRIFVLLVSAATLWIIGNLLADNLQDLSDILFWSRFSIVGPILVAPIFYIFAEIFPNHDDEFSLFRAILILSTSIPLLLLVPTELNIVSVSKTEAFGISYVPGPLYLILGLYLFAFLIGGLYKAYSRYKVSTGVERLQISYFYFGFIATVSVATITSLILPILGVSDNEITSVGPASTLFLFTTTTYVLVKHRLFGIRFVISKIITRVVLAIIPFLSFYAVYYLSVILWGRLLDPRATILNIVFAFVYSHFFSGISQKVESSISKVVVYKGRDPSFLLQSVQRVLGNEIDLDKLFTSFISNIIELYDPRFIDLVLISKDTGKIYRHISSEKGALTLGEQEIRTILNVGLKEYIEIEHKERFKTYEYAGLRDFMHRNRVSIIFPVLRKTSYRGFLLIGNRENLKPFTVEEVDLIDSLVDIFSLAVSRSLLYSEVSDLNKNLQQKIEDATEELQDYVTQLQEARRRERDMMDIMGHELRTPLTIIKIKQSLLRKKAKENPEQFNREEFLKVDESIHEALEREIRLLETMLSSTKIDAGRMDLSLDEVELKRLIDNTVLGHTTMAQDHKLDLRVEPFDSSITIFADPVRIAEVLDNFVNNAIKYTPKGSVTISVEADDKMVTLHVSDTGIGMSKSAQNRLGEKWYRENQYIEQKDENGNGNSNNIVRPGGSGLGLYVAFGLVRLMGGNVTVESELGKGSTFSFTVPRYTGQNPNVSKTKGKDLFKRMKLEKEVVEDEIQEEDDQTKKHISKISSDNGHDDRRAVDATPEAPNLNNPAS